MRATIKKTLSIHLPIFNDLPVETSVSTFVYKGQERVVMYPDTECQDHLPQKAPLYSSLGQGRLSQMPRKQAHHIAAVSTSFSPPGLPLRFSIKSTALQNYNQATKDAEYRRNILPRGRASTNWLSNTK